MTRPVTNGKRSWGPIQFTGAVRDTTITDGSGASLKLPDAGEQFFMRVPTAGTQMTISLKVYRKVDYAGTLPQLIVRQPGQADETDTDTGNAEEFNTLSVTISPATLPPWIDVFIRSNNTASSGNFSDRKSTRLNSSHQIISYAVFCLKKKKKKPSLQQGDSHPRERVARVSDPTEV